MLRSIIGAAGLGLVGIDPFTAVYILSLGLRKEKRSNISLFMAVFVVGSIVPGAVLSALFGAAAADYLNLIIPEDNSPFWVVVEVIVALVMIVWALRKYFSKDVITEKREEAVARAANASMLKYIATGAVFAAAAFTDPTYYAVMLLGGEAKSFWAALLFLSEWLLVSQSPAFVVYFANEFGMLHELTGLIDRLKSGRLQKAKRAVYALVMTMAVLLLADVGSYTLVGEYLF